MDLFKKKPKAEQVKNSEADYLEKNDVSNKENIVDGKQEINDLASTEPVYDSKEGDETPTETINDSQDELVNDLTDVEKSLDNIEPGAIKKALGLKESEGIVTETSSDNAVKNENTERIDVIIQNENGSQSILQGEESPLVLNGSSIHESVYQIGEEEVQLGTIVQKSFEESGLTIEEWNGLEESERDTKIDITLDAMLNGQKESNLQEESIKEVVSLRVLIDESMQFVEASLGKRNDASKSIFKSKAWLGKLLEELGSGNPYATAKPVSKSIDIPPTADVAQGLAKLVYDFKLKNDVEQIVFLRAMLESNIKKLNLLKTDMDFVIDKRLAAIAKTQSYVNLCEARFELGRELGILRDKNK